MHVHTGDFQTNTPPPTLSHSYRLQTPRQTPIPYSSFHLQQADSFRIKTTITQTHFVLKITLKFKLLEMFYNIFHHINRHRKYYTSVCIIAKMKVEVKEEHKNLLWKTFVQIKFM